MHDILVSWWFLQDLKIPALGKWILLTFQKRKWLCPESPKECSKSYFQLLIRRCWDLGVVIAPLDHTFLSAPPQGSRAGKEGILPLQRWKAERRAT